MISQEEYSELKALFLSLPVEFAEDYNSEFFKNYEAYTTSVNVTLSNIEDAFSFSNFHEGIHLGVILSLRKLV
jgi:hypothetical protein